MNVDVLSQHAKEFEKRIQEKNSWGKNEVMAAYREIQVKVLADAINQISRQSPSFPPEVR